jgi:restriction system protein
MALWLVRCGRHESTALSSGFVGIGWPEVGDLSGVPSVDGIRQAVRRWFPEAKPATLTNWTGQIDAFLFKIQLGDLVAMPLKTAPTIAFGRVTGPYRYQPEAPSSVRHQRAVFWIRDDFPRDILDQDSRNSLGSIMTVCRIQRNNAEERILGLLKEAST